jgi:hypothetical protein
VSYSRMLHVRKTFAYCIGHNKLGLHIMKCDICPLIITSEEMKIVSGHDISFATYNGFLPTNIAKHSPMKDISARLGVSPPSDSSTWVRTVIANQNTNWGLCQSCFSEFNTFKRIRNNSMIFGACFIVTMILMIWGGDLIIWGGDLAKLVLRNFARP